MQSKKVLLTGCAGFIGSNMAERLLEHNEVIGIDNFSNVDDRFIRIFSKNSNFHFHQLDVRNQDDVLTLDDCEAVIHFAANSDVRYGSVNPELDFDVNVKGTMNVLEYMRKKDIPEILFASSSTVYGEAETLPTPEDYGPSMPISTYGASKLAGEGFITAYAHYYGIRATIFRFANIVGRNSTHGVIYDFINKLRKNPQRLEILGDGTQRKSYMHVSDCTAAILYVHDKSKKTDIYNLGDRNTSSVVTIADEIVKQMDLKDVKYEFTGGTDGRGWKGDVKIAQLSVEKLLTTGWRNKFSSDEAVSAAVKESLQQLK